MAYPNDVAALNPENWSDAIQANLYKEMTCMEVADLKFKAKLASGTQVHFPMFGGLATTAYVKGTDVTVQALDTTDEFLTVDQQWESSFYLDTVDKVQNLYSAMEAGVREATYAIKQKIETVFYAEVLNASDTFDAGDSGMGGANGSAIALTTTNVFTAFTRAAAKLEATGVNTSSLVAVVSPQVAAVIAEKAVSSGFNLADATLKNGYAGDFNNVKVYVSNFLDTSSSRTHCYFGVSRQISLAMQIAPTTKIDSDPLKFGNIVKLLTVFGVKTFNKASQRFLDLQVTVA